MYQHIMSFWKDYAVNVLPLEMCELFFKVYIISLEQINKWKYTDKW